MIKKPIQFRIQYPESKKRWREKNKEKEWVTTKRYWAENPESRKAHSIVSNAIRGNKLKKKKCIVCRNEKSEAHHDDYSKPLEILWFCRQCHMNYHRYKKIWEKSTAATHIPKSSLPSADEIEAELMLLVGYMIPYCSKEVIGLKSIVRQVAKKIRERLDD